MHAIILAAGIGNRLSTYQNKPKCLLEFNGKSLLQRHLDNLGQLGIKKLTIVIGHQSEIIEQAISQYTGELEIELILNEEYTLGSVVSLWSARHVLTTDTPVLLMDADVLYNPLILKRLTETTHKSCLLLDQDFEAGDEPVKIPARNGAPVDFRKLLPANLDFDMIGESVGFFLLSPFMARSLGEKTEQYVAENKKEAPHEEAIRDLILTPPGEDFGIEDVTGLGWIEIDYPEDVERAEREILPILESALT